MNRFVIAVALSIALFACSHTSEQGKNYTVTFSSLAPSAPRSIFSGQKIYLGYVHNEHARDWKVYELSSLELCAAHAHLGCWVIWFDKVAPETEEEFIKWDEGELDSFVEIAGFIIDDGEVSSMIDCDFIEAPDVDSNDPDKISVECADGKIW